MKSRTLAVTLAAGTLVAAGLVVFAQAAPAASVPTRSASAAIVTTAVPPSGIPGDPPGADAPGPGAANAPGPAHHRPLRLAHRAGALGVLHAQWTTKSKNGDPVTHEVIRGVAAPVGADATTITVTATDTVAQTFTTSDATKVWKVVLVDGKRHVEQVDLTAVTDGARIVVQGTGRTAPYRAVRILVTLGG